MAHPAVAQAAVIAVPDDRWGERPLAVISLRAGAQTSPAELREHLAHDFAKWQLPDRFEFVEAIPCTATGTFKKSRLVRFHDVAADLLGDPLPPTLMCAHWTGSRGPHHFGAVDAAWMGVAAR